MHGKLASLLYFTSRFQMGVTRPSIRFESSQVEASGAIHVLAVSCSSLECTTECLATKHSSCSDRFLFESSISAVIQTCIRGARSLETSFPHAARRLPSVECRVSETNTRRDRKPQPKHLSTTTTTVKLTSEDQQTSTRNHATSPITLTTAMASVRTHKRSIRPFARSLSRLSLSHAGTLARTSYARPASRNICTITHSCYLPAATDSNHPPPPNLHRRLRRRHLQRIRIRARPDADVEPGYYQQHSALPHP